ncbi:hypothetical protein M3J09_002684 [Ascochyta lentis]
MHIEQTLDTSIGHGNVRVNLTILIPPEEHHARRGLPATTRFRPLPENDNGLFHDASWSFFDPSIEQARPWMQAASSASGC